MQKQRQRRDLSCLAILRWMPIIIPSIWKKASFKRFPTFCKKLPLLIVFMGLFLDGSFREFLKRLPLVALVLKVTFSQRSSIVYEEKCVMRIMSKCICD